MSSTTKLGTAGVLTFALLVASPGALGAIAAAPPSSPAAAADLTVGGASTLTVKSGCTATAKVSVTFTVSKGDRVRVELRGIDGDGRSVNGVSSPVIVDSSPVSGRATFSDRLWLCGELHTAGRGKVIALVQLNGESFRKDRAVSFKYRSAVSLAKPASKVKRGSTVRLHGAWSRGKGFSPSLTYLDRTAQRIVVQFRTAAGKWKSVNKVGIDSRGRWSTRVKVSKAGSWRALVEKDARNLGATSTVRTIKLKG